MMRAGTRFGDYNFREFAVRRVRTGFRLNMSEQDPAKITSLIAAARQDLAMLERQATVSTLFRTGDSIFEQKL